MRLKTRILTLTAALVMLASAASWIVYQQLSDNLIERWGQQVTEIQVRYDSARMLSSLEREIGLVRQMARSESIIAWAQAPADPTLKSRALRELESFRTNFSDGSYFLALHETGGYYYNSDADYRASPFRYVLNPADPNDAWYFQLVEEGRDFHLNVNPDVELGVTKLWVDVLIRNGDGKILGMLGTGLTLDDFLKDIVSIDQDGITTLFVDYNGAIQLYRDSNYIDFASILKPEGQKNTVDMLLSKNQDKQKILGMLQLLKKETNTPGRVESGFVTVNGSPHLAGAAYLPSIGWFEITLLDLKTLIPRSVLWPLVAVFLVTLLSALGIFYFVVQYRILRPVTGLERAVNTVREGRFDLPYLPKPDNEIGQLADHFEKMTAQVKSHTETLEARVAERTDQLHQLARTDALTGVYNRRGIDEALAAAIDRSQADQSGIALMLLDIDHFKAINDQQGHQVGDNVLRKVSAGLQAALPPRGQIGRWGGDEFLIVIPDIDAETLHNTADHIRQSVESASRDSGPPVTTSLGAYLAAPGTSADAMLTQADRALYAAKQSGRNQVNLVVA